MSVYKTMEAAQLKMFCHKKSNESAYMFELPPFQYKIMTILLHMDIMSPKFYTTNQLLNGFKIPLRCQLFALNDFSSKTARRTLKKNYMKVPWVTLYLGVVGWCDGAG